MPPVSFSLKRLRRIFRLRWKWRAKKRVSLDAVALRHGFRSLNNDNTRYRGTPCDVLVPRIDWQVSGFLSLSFMKTGRRRSELEGCGVTPRLRFTDQQRASRRKAPCRVPSFPRDLPSQSLLSPARLFLTLCVCSDMVDSTVFRRNQLKHCGATPWSTIAFHQ